MNTLQADYFVPLLFLVSMNKKLLNITENINQLLKRLSFNTTLAHSLETTKTTF